MWNLETLSTGAPETATLLAATIPDSNTWLVAAAALGALALVGGITWLGRRGAMPTLSVMRRPEPGQRAAERIPVAEQTAAAQLNAAMFLWLNQHEEDDDLWSAFDQVIREALTEHLGATRVRCYRVEAGRDNLRRLASGRTGPPTNEPSARAGVLGHTATTGREYVAGDATHGPLVDALAADTADGWTWVWPIQNNDRTIGVIAVGHLHDPDHLTPETRTTVGQALTLYWRHIDCLEQLRINQRTDPASGVLTRSDFFTRGDRALAESYGANEPVVVVVLRLEGLRRLDDEGQWQARDALIQGIGRAIGQRVRSDDLVGRFADDRFVVLLRRLDSGLGALIATKLLDTADDQLGSLADIDADIHIRAGLAGSGLSRPPLEQLLTSAFDAVERARHAGDRLATDLPDAPPKEESSR